MKRFLVGLIIIMSVVVVVFSLLRLKVISQQEDEINLPNRDFQEIGFYGDGLSDSSGLRAFPWGIEIWRDPGGIGNEMPVSKFEKGQVILKGNSLHDVIVLAIPDPPNKPQVKGGVKYLQSFEIKLDGVDGYGVRLIHQWFNSGDSLLHQLISSQYGNFEKGTSDWHRISLIGTAPLDAKRGDIIIELWGSGTVFIRNPEYHEATLLDFISQLSAKEVMLGVLVILIIILVVTEILSLISLLVAFLQEQGIRKITIVLLIIIFCFPLTVTKIPRDKENQVLVNVNPQNLSSEEEIGKAVFENTNLLEFRGIDFYPYPYSYSSPLANKSLDEILVLPEINYIQLRFFLFQENLESNEIVIHQSQENPLVEVIRKIHKSGKQVSLMPHLYSNDYVYIANLNPENKMQWFDSYTKALLIFAKLAEQEKVELFSVGNELTNLMSDPLWNKVVEEVKKVYHGKLTVKLNCWYQEIQLQNILSWNWLEKLDYIGIAAYFDLTNTNEPSLAELKQAWFYNRNKINIVADLQKISDTFQKPIFFSEIGYRNIDGVNIEPWNAKALPPQSIKELRTGKEDTDEAILCLKALFETFRNQSWFKGTIWFMWPTALNPASDMSYSIRNKPLILQELLNQYQREINH